jgi:hypothetical protein
VNERIRELAEQARKHFPKTESSGEFWVLDEAKFADLIVQECISQIDAQCFPTQSHELVQKGAWNAYLRATIKQHFGDES